MTARSCVLLVLVAGIGIATLGCVASEPEVAQQAVSAGCSGDADCEVGLVCENGNCEPAVCPDIYDPVCGENGMTYSNACEARAAHVAVAHSGECLQVCGGVEGLPCGEGELCDLPAGECQGADLEGVCVEWPEACSEIFDPVCACDGTTYSNDCFRMMAGAQLDYAGECEAMSE